MAFLIFGLKSFTSLYTLGLESATLSTACGSGFLHRAARTVFRPIQIPSNVHTVHDGLRFLKKTLFDHVMLTN